MKVQIINEVIQVKENGDFEIEATEEALLLFKEKMNNKKPFSYAKGDHLKDAIKNEKILRSKTNG